MMTEITLQEGIALLRETLVFYADGKATLWEKTFSHGPYPPPTGWDWLEPGEDSGPMPARRVVEQVQHLLTEATDDTPLSHDQDIFNRMFQAVRWVGAQDRWRHQPPDKRGVVWYSLHATHGGGPMAVRRTLIDLFPDEYLDIEHAKVMRASRSRRDRRSAWQDPVVYENYLKFVAENLTHEHPSVLALRTTDEAVFIEETHERLGVTRTVVLVTGAAHTYLSDIVTRRFELGARELPTDLDWMDELLAIAREEALEAVV